MPPPIFKNLVIATAGPLPGQLTTENLQNWTQIRKGSFSQDLTDEVTHLLCTKEQFAKKVPLIKQALARKGKRLRIVHHDWFEYSTVADKRQKENDFSLRTSLVQQKAKEREAKRRERCKKEGERGVNPDYFKIYRDEEFFEYNIVLTRNNEEYSKRGEKYNLCLWESIAKPHLYWFVAKFHRPYEDTGYHRPSLCSAPFDQEMGQFRSFFKKRTDVDWQDRVIKQGTTSIEFFQYSPPSGGKPVGQGLRFCYDYCLEVNAQLRRLPSPPVAGEEIKDRAVMDEAGESSSDAALQDEDMKDVEDSE